MDKLLATPTWGASSSSATEAGGEMFMGFATMGTDLAKNPCPCIKLTIKQRFQGFFACFSLGVLLSFISSFTFWAGDLKTFGALYTIGNILALFATGFLVGPVSQCKNMFHKKRVVTTIVYLVTLIVTISIAFVPKFGGQTVAVIICVICQMMALTWYTLSYIPFARDAVKNAIMGCFRG